MQVNVESLSSVKKRLSFEIPGERMDREIDNAYARIRKNAAIKGFRKGKVPQSMVEKHFSDRMADEVVRTLVNDTMYKALAEHKIFPVGEPLIDSGVPERGTVFSYSATVEVFPEVEPQGYQGMELKREQFVADESVIDTRLEELRQRSSQLRPAGDDHVAATGDFVTIDFVGYVDGEPFEGGTGQDYSLELGSGRFIPGFEEQLVGARGGEAKRLSLSFPEDYGFAPLAGKAAEFDVTVKEIKVKEVPELDDDFARETGECDSLADMRAKLTEMFEAQERQRIEAQLRERLVNGLVAANPIELPEVAVQRQLALLLQDAQNRLARQRMTLEMMGMNEDLFRREYRGVAESQLRGSLVLAAVARKEGLTVGQEDIDGHCRIMAANTGNDLERITSFYRTNDNARDNLAAQLLEDKALVFIMEQASITDVPKAELEPAAEGDE
jgi:trigger factor